VWLDPSGLSRRYFNAAGGEGGEEFVVAIYVVVEAMYEDQFCN
jgi:hypothetical protein